MVEILDCKVNTTIIIIIIIVTNCKCLYCVSHLNLYVMSVVFELILTVRNRNINLK